MTTPCRVPMPILIAEDDEEDRQLTRAALAECETPSVATFVRDGRELMDYLNQSGEWAEPEVAPRPGLVLLDLNMPRMNGFEVLDAIRSHPELRGLPVVVLTTSRCPDDVRRSYDLGVNCYVSKPPSFDELVDTLRVLKRFWLEIASLPSPGGAP